MCVCGVCVCAWRVGGLGVGVCMSEVEGVSAYCLCVCVR